MSSRSLPLLALLLGVAGTVAASPAELKIATWNLEWFMTPETLRALTPACLAADAPRDGARRAVPCDVAHELSRGLTGPRDAQYDFCFSGRVTVQNNGFAIRHGLPFSCGPELEEISLHDDVRRGVELRLFPGTPRELRLLSVHLKSGCARDPLDSARPSCVQLRAQVPSLEHWIDAQASAHIPFALLGDFNRDLRREPAGVSLWGDIDDSDPQEADLVNTAEGQAFQNCSPGQTFSGYIDYILLGQRMARGLVPNSFGREVFRPKEALRRKLSDHCPVFIRIRVADAAADLS